MEGIIAKRKGSIYEPGKCSGSWLKYKIKKSQEFVIGGYTMGGNPFDALIVGCYEGGKLKYVAKVRAGFVPHMRCGMWPLLQPLRTDKCPFSDLPEKRRTLYSLTREEMQNCQWLSQPSLRRSSLENGPETDTVVMRVCRGSDRQRGKDNCERIIQSYYG